MRFKSYLHELDPSTALGRTTLGSGCFAWWKETRDHPEDIVDERLFVSELHVCAARRQCLRRVAWDRRYIDVWREFSVSPMETEIWCARYQR